MAMTSCIKYKPVEGKFAELYYSKCNKIVYPKKLAKFGEIEHVLPNGFINYAESILNFQIRANDVWVFGFPKSGTTWTQEMVWLIGHDLDYEKAREKDITRRFPLLERDADDVETCIDGVNNLDLCENMGSPRYIKSHLPPDLLPVGLWKVKPKMIYVERNVKDVCVSLYHHFVWFEGFTGSFELFIESFCNGSGVHCPYWPFVQEFHNLKNKHDNILFLTYEEMKRDIRKAIEITAKFLDKSLTEHDIKKLIHHLSFNQMKENPHVNKESYKTFGQELGVINPGNFIRKGKIGSWKEEMSKESIKKIESWIIQNNTNKINQ